MRWFKLYGQDFLTDSRIGALHPLQKLMWVALLCVASQDDERTGIIKFLTEDRLMDLCGVSLEMLEDVGVKRYVTLETFCNMGLVTMPDEDTVIVTNFHKKQTQQSTSTERVAAWRARKQAVSQEKVNVTEETDVMLQSNGRVEESRIDNIQIQASQAMQEIDPVNEIIGSFKEVNPLISRYFSNSTQRQSVKNLLKEMPKDQLLAVIKFLPKSNASQYAPTITTPYQLEKKFAQLKAWADRKKEEAPKVVKIS